MLSFRTVYLVACCFVESIKFKCFLMRLLIVYVALVLVNLGIVLVEFIGAIESCLTHISIRVMPTLYLNSLRDKGCRVYRQLMESELDLFHFRELDLHERL